jgi:hypothetical protein
MSLPVVESAGPAPMAWMITLETNVPTRLILDLSDRLGHSFRIESASSQIKHDGQWILGLRMGRNYDLTVTAEANDGQRVEWPDVFQITTPAVQSDFPTVNVVQLTEVAAAEPGFTLMEIRRWEGNFSYLIIVDLDGEVVWYLSTDGLPIAKLLPNGNLLVLEVAGQVVEELDLAGNVLWSVYSQDADCTPACGPVVATELFHHDVARIETTGTYLTTSRVTRVVDNFPVTTTDPPDLETVSVADELIIEFDADGNIVGEWPFLDMMKPTRIGYDGNRAVRNDPDGRLDWVHTNAVTYVDGDDSIIASLRHQDAVVKFSRETSELQWILGTHSNWSDFESYLLNPVAGSAFDWQYHQHSPKVTPAGTILLFDNGNNRASPFTGEVVIPPANNYSRAVEYAIDESAMTVSQVWEYGMPQSGESLFSPIMGDVDWLPQTGNMLVTFSSVCTEDGIPSGNLGNCLKTPRVIEVQKDTGTRVMDFQIDDPGGPGWLVYRSERLSTLYRDGTLSQLTE